MRHRVVFFGSPRWLNSPQLQRLCLDRRIITIDSRPSATPPSYQSSDPTLALVQLGVNFAPGLAAIRSMSRPNSAVRCIAVSRSSNDRLLRGCVEAGAWALIFESADAPEFLDVIHSVGAGRLAYPQDVLDRIVTHRGRMALAPAPPPGILAHRR